jgi:hypothetical protein
MTLAIHKGNSKLKKLWLECERAEPARGQMENLFVLLHGLVIPARKREAVALASASAVFHGNHQCH